MKKYQLIAYSVTLLVMAICLLLPLSVQAKTDGYLENDGKMEIKTDRVQITDEEKQKQKEAPQQTVLEEKNIPLFTVEMEKEVAAQKKAQKERLKNLKNSLFTGETVQTSSVKTAKSALFAKAQAAKANEDTKEQPKEEANKSKNKTMGGIIGGALAALVGGAYAASRNVFE